MQKNISRPFLKVTAQGITSTWLFDTGAQRSVMSLKEFRKIRVEARPPKLPVNIQLTAAGSTQLDVLGVYNLTLTAFGKTIQHPIYVCRHLTQPAILGIDAIHQFGLSYSTTKQVFFFDENISLPKNSFFSPDMLSSDNAIASLSVIKAVTIPPLTSLSLSLSSLSSNAYRPPPGVLGIANISDPSLPLLSGGPGLVQTNRLGEVTVRVSNCSPLPLSLPRGARIGYMESVLPTSVHAIDTSLFTQKVAEGKDNLPPPYPPIRFPLSLPR